MRESSRILRGSLLAVALLVPAAASFAQTRPVKVLRGPSRAAPGKTADKSEQGTGVSPVCRSNPVAGGDICRLRTTRT